MGFIRSSRHRVLKAACTFNVLLFEYNFSYSLALSNPHLISLLATTASVHMSEYQWLEGVPTRVHLSDCLNAFKAIGETWDLAESYCQQLNGWMDAHGINSESDVQMTDTALLDFHFDLG